MSNRVAGIAVIGSRSIGDRGQVPLSAARHQATIEQTQTMTGNNTDYRTKGRAVFLAAIMVLSMLAVPMAFTGSVSAQSDVTVNKTPVHYENSSGDGVIEVSTNNGSLDTVVDTINISVGGQDDDVELQYAGNVTKTNGKYVVDAGDVYPRVESITFFDGSDEVLEEDVIFAGETLNVDAGDDLSAVYQGSTVAITNNSNDNFRANIESDSVFVQRSTGSNSSIIRFDTTDRALEEYEVTNRDNTSESANFTLRNLGLGIEIDDTEITDAENLTGTVSAGSDDRAVLVEVIDEDDDVVAEDDGNLGGDAEYEFDVGQLEAGTYEVEATDLSSGVTVTSDTVEVSEVGDGVANLDANSYEATQGDVVEFTIEFNDATSDGTLLIGDEEEDGYQANISVEDGDDDGEVTVLFNTYLAGLNGSNGVTAADIVSAASDDDTATLDNIDDEQNLDTTTRMLDTGDYEVASSTGDNETAADDPDDVASLVITERAEPEMQLWRTSPAGLDDVVEAADDDDEDELQVISDAIENDVITEADSVAIDTSSSARSDVLIHQINAPGFSGAVDAKDQDAAGDALYDLLTENGTNQAQDADINSVELFLEQQNPRRNADPKDVDVSDLSRTEFNDVFTVIYDDEDGVFYIALDQNELNSVESDTLVDGDEYAVDFTLQDERLLRGSDRRFQSADAVADAYQVAGDEFSVEDAEGSFDTTDVDGDDYVTVLAAEDQAISGSTNIAPGTEISVRIRSDEASSSFITTNSEIVVQPDGTFETSFDDFNGTASGDTFDVDVRRAAFSASADGLVVEDAEPANFEVSDLDPADVTVEQGDVIEVSATIENTGEEEATQDVTFQVDGNELGSEEVTLDGGEDTTVTFSDIDTSDLEPGDYEHGVFTDDDSQTATLTVEGVSDDDDSTDDDSTDDDSTDDDSTDDDSTDDDSTDDSTDDDETDDEGGVPGFGVIVALVALIGAAMLAARRQN